ncbi:MAG: hypothetical protein LBD46_06375 [Endomicrobium sp.]|nr:hypothetical protein [Endomicrobium sp.]
MPLYKYPQTQDYTVFNENRNKILEYAQKHKINAALHKNTVFTLIKDCLKSFLRIPIILFTNTGNNIYAAFVPNGGLGDILRQKTVLKALVEMYPDIVIDIYNKSKYPLFKEIKNIRFFLNKYAVDIMKYKYDIVIEYEFNFELSKVFVINSKKRATVKILENLKKYKKQYPYCFDGQKYFFMQQEAVKNKLNLINVLKITAGVDNIDNISLSISYTEKPLSRFGILPKEKYITVQCGFANKDNFGHAKLWSDENWKRLLAIIKNKISPDIKIVQVGVNSPVLKNADINAVNKTSLDGLCSILKTSLLHIDTDCGCTLQKL